MSDGRSAWQGRNLWALLALGLAMGTAFDAMGSFSTVQEGAKADLLLSDGDLGLVQGVSAAIPLALFSIPLGILVDRTHRVRLLLALAALWTIGTLLTAVAQSVPLLFVGRMLTATGTTGGLTAALSIGADLCRPAERGRATLLVTLGQRIGIAAAFAIPGWLFGWLGAGGGPGMLAHIAPWRGVHYLLAIASALLFVPLLLLREPVRQEVAAGPHAPFGTIARELWSRRAFLIPLFAGQIAVVMADTAAVIWAAPVLSRSYGQHPGDFAGWMGLLILGTGIAGAVLGGFSADLGQKSTRRGGILLGAVIAAGIGIPAGLFPLSPSVPVFAAALGTLALCGTLTGIVVAVALTVLIPNELRGVCIGAFIAIAGVIGYGIAPLLVTGVSGLLGGEAHLSAALAIVDTAVGALSFAAFLLAMRHAPASALRKPIG